MKKTVLTFIISLSLVACGQDGALYLPPKDKPQPATPVPVKPNSKSTIVLPA